MNIFDVNSDYFIERETIEDHGYEFQIRELRKIDEYEAKCTIYIWAPDGHEFDEVPGQFYEDPITWKSSLFGENFPDVVFETSTAYLMHDGGCCCLIGTVGHP